MIFSEYNLALENEDSIKIFMKNHAIKGLILTNTQNSQIDLKGEYYILSYGDWNIETYTKNMFEISNTLMPQSVVLYKDGEIREEFDTQISFSIEPIAEQEKQKIVEAYRKWKENRGTN